MPPLKLVAADDPILRQKATPIIQITNRHRETCAAMVQFLRESNNGVGLAAPQIGVSKRIIAICVRAGIIAVVNPVVEDLSEETSVLEEGCLSMPGVLVPIARPISCTLKGQMPFGSDIRMQLTGIAAKAAQHEIDHLDGILITDYLPEDAAYYANPQQPTRASDDES